MLIQQCGLERKDCQMKPPLMNLRKKMNSEEPFDRWKSLRDFESSNEIWNRRNPYIRFDLVSNIRRESLSITEPSPEKTRFDNCDVASQPLGIIIIPFRVHVLRSTRRFDVVTRRVAAGQDTSFNEELGESA